MTRNSASEWRTRRWLLALVSTGAVCVLGAPAAAVAATRYVDDTGGTNVLNNCTNQATPCLTVQYAVDQAIAGETVDLAAGTYSPGAVIDKANLTISGAGKANTRVSPSLALARTFDLRGSADGLTIQDLEMLGPYTGAGAITDRSGIHVNNTAGLNVADLTLRNLELTGMKYAVDVRHPGSATGWTLDSVDANINEYGARFQGATRNLSVTASHFDFNNFGLYVGHTGTTPRTPGVFQDVEIADSSFDGNATKGLYFEQAADMDLHGLSVVTPPPPSPRVDVNPNNGIDLNVKYGNFANIRIADSVFSGATEAGLLIHGRNDGTLYSPVPGSLDNVDLERLIVTGNSPTPVSSAGGINVATATTNVSVTASRILGNGSGGLISYADAGPASGIDATDNWWGCNEGPTVNGSNACSTAVQTAGFGQLDADPWLVLSASANAGEIAIGGATTDVTAALDTNSAGDPAGPPPDGPTVGFATDLGSIAPGSDQLVAGAAATVLTSGPNAGTAHVVASLDSAEATADVEFVAPAPQAPSGGQPQAPPAELQAAQAVLDQTPLPGCSERSIVLTSVVSDGERVRVSGLALARDRGQRVAISARGHTVAHATVRADGTFQVSLPTPAARHAASIRYQAVLANRRSSALKLSRRLLVGSQRQAGAALVQISGRLVTNGHARRLLTIQRQTGCGSAKAVAVVRTGRDGRFQVVLARPTGLDVLAVYRLRTSSGGRTYTLPIVVRA